jgi:cyclophilin family peptidyl-prolyl cis-trans isomerase
VTDYAIAFGPALAFVVWVNWGWSAVRFALGPLLLLLLAAKILTGESRKLLPTAASILVISTVLVKVDSVSNPFVNNEPDAAEERPLDPLERVLCQIDPSSSPECARYFPEVELTESGCPAASNEEPAILDISGNDPRQKLVFTNVAAGKPLPVRNMPSCVDRDKTYLATFETMHGNFSVELDTAAAPVAVNNFVFLSRWNYYDNSYLGFYGESQPLVLETGHHIVGLGDPEAPGYEIPLEPPTEQPYYPPLALVMETGSQTTTASGGKVFITLDDTDASTLGDNYTRFGSVASGQDVIAEIERYKSTVLFNVTVEPLGRTEGHANPPPTTEQPPDLTQAVEPTCPSPGTTERLLQFTGPPPMCIDLTHTYIATLDTNYGPVDITLDPELAPDAVNNFVFLARWNFFDSVAFEHNDQGGILRLSDPLTPDTNRGGPGYELDVEAPPGPISYPDVGVIMASGSQEGKTSGSKFVIVLSSVEKAQLEGAAQSFTLFGKVTSGLQWISTHEGTDPGGFPGVDRQGQDQITGTPIVIKDVIINEQE